MIVAVIASTTQIQYTCANSWQWRFRQHGSKAAGGTWQEASILYDNFLNVEMKFTCSFFTVIRSSRDIAQFDLGVVVVKPVRRGCHAIWPMRAVTFNGDGGASVPDVPGLEVENQANWPAIADDPHDDNAVVVENASGPAVPLRAKGATLVVATLVGHTISSYADGRYESVCGIKGVGNANHESAAW